MITINLDEKLKKVKTPAVEALHHHWEFFPRHSKLRYAEKSYKPRQDHQRQWVFCHANGQRLKAFYTSFINGCRRAGLENVSPHTLRHTFASHLIMAGVNLKAVQTLLGHKSIKITMDIYGHLTPDHLEASINRLPYRKETQGKVVPLFAGQEIKMEPGR